MRFGCCASQIVLIIGIAMCVFGVLMLGVALLLARRLRQQGRGRLKPRQLRRCMPIAALRSCCCTSTSIDVRSAICQSVL